MARIYIGALLYKPPNYLDVVDSNPHLFIDFIHGVVEDGAPRGAALWRRPARRSAAAARDELGAVSPKDGARRVGRL
jgi:hypothetical protein